jgi:SPP1 gp7 family putative phage head morphogenesis protein
MKARIRDPMLLGALAALSSEERVRLRESSKQATALERKWIRRFRDEIDRLDVWVFRDLFENGQYAESKVDFLPLVLEHSFNSMAVGMRTAREDADEQRLPRKLAGPPGATRIPRSLADLRRLYDLWKRKRNLPPRQRVIAEKLKKAYLKRVQSVWERYGDDFRRGKTYDKDAVRAVLRREGDMVKSRADTVVQTETTLYYNKARRTIYDRSPDVTHYLFVAIRDQATTKWCKSRQGLVYAKGDPLLDKETPPIHYNCRSELLPLSRLNPSHLKLIEDPARRRRNHSCEPLPPGWTARAA